MRSIRTAKAAGAAATFESLGTSLSRHRTLTRVGLAALSFTILISLTQQAVPAQAGREAARAPAPEPLLPRSVGNAIATDGSVVIEFETPMDAASVEAALQVLPAQSVDLYWNRSQTALTVMPAGLWRADERYLVVVPDTSKTDAGTPLPGPRRYTFTTQASPVITGVEVRLAGEVEPPADEATSGLSQVLEVGPDGQPAAGVTPMASTEGVSIGETPTEVSPTSTIIVSFSQTMDAADVESRFSIAPAVDGELSWRGTDLVFTPGERLQPGMRYTISLAGAHDHRGNVLRSSSSVSFIVAEHARLTKTSPRGDSNEVNPAVVQMWFSRPMQVDSTNAAFSLTDGATGHLVGGLLSWNEAGTLLTYVPDRPFAAGRTFTIRLDDGALDVDGNAITVSWSFTTPAAATRSTTTTRTTPAVPAPAPAATLAGYALNQVNAARAAYGFAPLVLDAAVSAVASAHAWDQARNNYFSHYGLDGSTRQVRLARGGVGFGWSGENQCYHLGMSQQATLNWCHSQFMAEPYPGYWNHIANILNPNARRMGIGIATVGDKTVITWDFTD